jgi:aminopeptidase N
MSEDTDFRLPPWILPTQYRLSLAPDLDAGTFSGTVAIDVQLSKPVDAILLNAVDLNLTEASVGPARARVEVDERRERVRLALDQTLPEGPAEIRIVFNGKLSSTMRGFYKSSYTLPDGTRRAMATTQFEASSARRAFPCFDEPALKARFDVELVVPADRTAISNTSVASEEPAEGGRKRVRFARTPVMSTYLLAFIVGEFETIEGHSSDRTPVRVRTTPGRSDLGRFALDTAIRGLDFFGGYYDIPYRTALDKLDLIAIPDFEAGAMENWGAITFREIVLFIDPEKSSVPMKRRVAEVVLHELAHQWFGNLVTMKWWNELWLNESFATFMAYKAADAIFPDWNVWDEYLSQTTSGGKSLDSLRSSHPVETPVRDPGEVDQIFDPISYNKGGSLLRMLEATIGPDVFRDGIRRYLQRHRYGNASTRDLWNALSEGTPWDVAWMMGDWTGQVGFPVLLAKKMHGRIHLRQERFLLDRDPDKAAPGGSVWMIPIAAVDATGRRATMRLEALEGDQPDEGWIKLNAGQTGFYLVHYDDEWRRSLDPMKLPPPDRYGLIEDSTSLMRAGYMSVSEFLSLVGRYEGEEDYNVWSQIAGGLGLLAEIFVGDPAVPKLEAWAQKLLRPILQEVGWEGNPSEPHDRVLLRSTVLGAAVRFGDPETIGEGRRRFVSAAAPESIAADLRSTVLTAAARYGDETAHGRMVRMYESAGLPEVRVSLLQALGSFRHESLLRLSFAYSLSDKVRPQDAMYVVAGAPIETRPTAWALLKENWATIDSRYGKSGMIARFIQYAAAGIPSEEHALDLEEFFRTHPAPFATERIRQVVEGVRIRASFRRRNSGALAAFFG